MLFLYISCICFSKHSIMVFEFTLHFNTFQFSSKPGNSIAEAIKIPIHTQKAMIYDSGSNNSVKYCLPNSLSLLLLSLYLFSTDFSLCVCALPEVLNDLWTHYAWLATHPHPQAEYQQQKCTFCLFAAQKHTFQKGQQNCSCSFWESCGQLIAI